MNKKIIGIYTLKQPLSHIGESESTASFLNTIRIRNNNGVTEVFAYNGNAIRGSLRDCAARYLLARLNIKIPKKEFHMLFSGGSIAGKMSVDIEQIVKYRELLPIISLFGAGVGNQLIPGKMAQGFAYPLCMETSSFIPVGEENAETSWKQLTGAIEFSRKDDSKDFRLRRFLDDSEERDNENPQQMRREVEYMVPGTKLRHEIFLSNISSIEEGTYISALEEWSKVPVLGGMAAAGFGLCDAEFTCNEEPYISVKDGNFTIYNQEAIAGVAEYESLIANRKDEIIALLKGKPL